MINKDAKVLLLLAPYWTPQIPPLGISSIKAYLNNDGFERVKIFDFNIHPTFKNLLNQYNRVLSDGIPKAKQSHFFNHSGYALQDLIGGYFRKNSDAERYRKFVRQVVDNYFYYKISSEAVTSVVDTLTTLESEFRKEFQMVLDEEQPEVLGFSAYSGSLMLSVVGFKMAKKHNAGILTMIGGGAFAEQLSIGSPNFEKFSAETKNCIDKIVVGEGEILTINLLNGELPKDQRVFSINDIKRSVIDVKEALLPDYTQLSVENYPHLSAYTSKSCPYQCSFCSETVYGGTYRKKPASLIVGELNKLYDIHKYQLFLFGDSLLNPLVDKLATEMIASPRRLYWDGYLRADPPVCDINNTLKWRQGGYYRARLGVESGSDHILKLMNKKIKAQQIKDAVKALATAGIKTTTYWLIGHPGETEEDFIATLDLIEEIGDYIYEADCNPFWFEVSGMVSSSEWTKNNQVRKLYGPEYEDIVFMDTWVLEVEPNRKEIFDRVNRFMEFTKKLGIPNPISLKDVFEADDRWERLHKNAVPSVATLLEHRNSDTLFMEDHMGLKINEATRLINADDGW